MCVCVCVCVCVCERLQVARRARGGVECRKGSSPRGAGHTAATAIHNIRIRFVLAILTYFLRTAVSFFLHALAGKGLPKPLGQCCFWRPLPYLFSFTLRRPALANPALGLNPSQGSVRGQG